MTHHTSAPHSPATASAPPIAPVPPKRPFASHNLGTVVAFEFK